MEKLPFNHGLIAFKNAVHAAEVGRAARIRDLAAAELLAKKAAAPSVEKFAAGAAQLTFSGLRFVAKIALRLIVKAWRAFIGADDVIEKSCIKCSPNLPIWANKFFGTWYDPRECATPAPRGWNEPAKPPVMPSGLDLHTLRDGETVVARTIDRDDDCHAIHAWNVLKTTTKADQLLRNAALSDADLIELGTVTGLSTDKAASLKPLRAKCLSNRQI